MILGISMPLKLSKRSQIVHQRSPPVATLEIRLPVAPESADQTAARELDSLLDTFL